MDPITLGIILLAVLGGVAFAVQQASDEAKGPKMANRFASLGTLSGMSKGSIVAAVGPPNSVSALPDGLTLLQWQTHGYHIALSFDGETCIGVEHEFLQG